jgi:crossover junction endonuclease MUS81
MPKPPSRSRALPTTDAVEEADGTAKPKKTRKPKPYVPSLRSGPYAIILALATLDEEASSGLTKAQTIELAQPHCDSSFSAPSDPSKYYTAWNSMKTLVEKDLVYEKGRPLRKYALTDEGWEVAKRIQGTIGGKETTPAVTEKIGGPEADLIEVESSSESGGPQQATEDSTPNVSEEAEVPFPTFSPVIVPPSAFTVELVLDVREVRAKEDRDYMAAELRKKGVPPTIRALELGDALWVAKCKDPTFLPQKGIDGDEIILDWIVERKRLDDLVGSIKDGRFHEQKFRLHKSGVKNVIYIIEEIAMNSDHFQRYEEAVESAIAGTQVVNGYFVKKTQKMDDTIRYLARMTMLLKSMYESKPLYVIPTTVLTSRNYTPMLKKLAEEQPSTNYNITYPAFASLASKSDSMTLRDVYLKMVMSTRGITGEKALEMQRRWRTPYDFAKAFEACGEGEEGKKRKRELVSGQMSDLVGRKKIAKSLSQKIAEVWADA